MKKNIILLAGMMSFSLLLPLPVFSGETDGMEEFEELAGDAGQIENGRLVVSLSLTAGDEEISSGMEISFSEECISIDMVYVSVPLNDGTSFEFVSEDVMRIFGKEAYISSEFLKDAAAGLETKAEDSEEEQLEPEDMPDCEWVRIEGTDIEPGAFEGWDEVFEGLEATHDSGVYVLNLGNEETAGVFRKLKDMMDDGTFENGEPFEMEALVGRYVDAAIEGLRTADAGAVTQKQEESLHEELGQGPVSMLYEYLGIETLADRFEDAVSDGFDVTISVCAGKDAAAGTYALEVTVQEYIPQELEDEWGVKLVPGDHEENVFISFLASIEPTEEPAGTEKPEEDKVITLEDLLREWAADGIVPNVFED